MSYVKKEERKRIGRFLLIWKEPTSTGLLISQAIFSINSYCDNNYWNMGISVLWVSIKVLHPYTLQTTDRFEFIILWLQNDNHQIIIYMRCLICLFPIRNSSVCARIKVAFYGSSLSEVYWLASVSSEEPTHEIWRKRCRTLATVQPSQGGDIDVNMPSAHNSYPIRCLMVGMSFLRYTDSCLQSCWLTASLLSLTYRASKKWHTWASLLLWKLPRLDCLSLFVSFSILRGL